MKSKLPIQQQKLFSTVKELIQLARQQVVRNVNQVMVTTYFEIGRMIVEEEFNGKERSDYGKHLLNKLSDVLSEEFGRGFSYRNLAQMRQFYISYRKQQTLSAELQNQKLQTPSAEFKLSWSHYVRLMRVNDENERKFYEIESVNNNWSIRELNRQLDTALYQRLVLSRDKEGVKALNEKGQIIEKP